MTAPQSKRTRFLSTCERQTYTTLPFGLSAVLRPINELMMNILCSSVPLSVYVQFVFFSVVFCPDDICQCSEHLAQRACRLAMLLLCYRLSFSLHWISLGTAAQYVHTFLSWSTRYFFHGIIINVFCVN